MNSLFGGGGQSPRLCQKVLDFTPTTTYDKGVGGCEGGVVTCHSVNSYVTTCDLQPMYDRRVLKKNAESIC